MDIAKVDVIVAAKQTAHPLPDQSILTMHNSLICVPQAGRFAPAEHTL